LLVNKPLLSYDENKVLFNTTPGAVFTTQGV
jgi:hypothetical protein